MKQFLLLVCLNTNSPNDLREEGGGKKISMVSYLIFKCQGDLNKKSFVGNL
jgi:hypothetical protein